MYHTSRTKPIMTVVAFTCTLVYSSFLPGVGAKRNRLRAYRPFVTDTGARDRVRVAWTAPDRLLLTLEHATGSELREQLQTVCYWHWSTRQGPSCVNSSRVLLERRIVPQMFYYRMTVHRNRFLVNKTNRYTEFQFYLVLRLYKRGLELYGNYLFTTDTK